MVLRDRNSKDMTKKKHKKHDEERVEVSAAPPTEADTVEAERDDLLDRLQRVSADYLNYQKRAGKELAEARQFANAELIKDLLAVLDDMERALDHAATDDNPLSEGMRLVRDKALAVLNRYGLKPIAAVGEHFDPQRHEAMMAQPAEDYDTPTVLRELQRGYEFKGRVLRPARVVVSAPPADAVTEGNADDSNNSE